MAIKNDENSTKKKVGRCALKTPVHGDCQVCGQPGHGSHFGVLACRACAAFFRRTVVMNRQYSCRRANGSCQISKDERYLCRLCRYNKCIMLGMTPDNVQWNRDVLSTTVEGRRLKKAQASDEYERDDYEPQGLANSQARLDGNLMEEHSLCPSTADSAAPDLKPADNVIPISTAESTATSGYNNYPFPLKETEQHRILFDISHIMEKLRKILLEFQPDESLPIEPLERMRLALLRHRRSQLTEPSLKILDSLSFVNYLTSWETLLCGIAEWLMHCREFAQLPIEEKMVLFKSSWIIWHRFERTTMSIELFGWRAVTEKLFAVSFRHAIMTDKVKFDIAPLSDHDPDYVKRMFEPFSGRLTEEVTKTCLEVNITLVEVAYILCTLVWHVEVICATLAARQTAVLAHPAQMVYGDGTTEKSAAAREEGQIDIVAQLFLPTVLLFHFHVPKLVHPLHRGKGVSPRTQAVAELYRDRISDDLHNYYTLTMKTSNYAGRLIRIMSIIQCIENIHHERSKVLELARIFDIFKVEMSEKGMFGC